jgi:hypothetical protein
VSRAAKGRSSIHRRSGGPGWEGWVNLGVHPVSGKRWRKHVRGATKTEVAGKIAALEKAREARAIAWDHTTTLDAWLQSWLAGRVSAGLRPNTVAGYRTDLKYVTRSGVGRVRLRDLTAEHMERVYSYILGLPRAGPGSVAHVKRTLNAALNIAVQRGHLARNPVLIAAAPRHTQPELEPYTPEEIRQLLTAAAHRRNGVRWSLALLGLRQGEVLGLRWPDVDLDSGELTVRHTLTWLVWHHGCSRGGECSKPAARCPQRYGGGAHLDHPSQMPDAAPSPSPNPSSSSSTNTAPDKRSNVSPPQPGGTTTTSLSPTPPVDPLTAPATAKNGTVSSRQPVYIACASTTYDTPQPPPCWSWAKTPASCSPSWAGPA